MPLSSSPHRMGPRVSGLQSRCKGAVLLLLSPISLSWALDRLDSDSGSLMFTPISSLSRDTGQQVYRTYSDGIVYMAYSDGMGS